MLRIHFYPGCIPCNSTRNAAGLLTCCYPFRAQVMEGLNDTAENLMQAIEKGEAEVSPSQLYAVASILEGVPYVNGAPQNTFVPGLIELAVRLGSDQHKLHPVAAADADSAAHDSNRLHLSALACP